MGSLKVAHLSTNVIYKGHNCISDLSPLKDIKSITELVLENNKIEDIGGLSSKPELV